MSALPLRIWAVLLLLPVIPVMAFYLVFKNQNYFELEDAARGIVATGPIAAYVALVLIGWTIYKRVSNLTGEISPLQSKILGSWDYVATSAHGTERQGSAEISEDHGQICMSGSFQIKDKPAGQWSSVMARIELQQLVVLYRLEDHRAEERTNSTAVLSVQINKNALDKMSGTWVVLGQAEALGDIVFTRGSSVRPIKAVVFDMDGVLFEGRNFWLDLHRRYGTEEAGIAAADAHLATDYDTLAELVVGELWRDKPAGPLLELVAAREYQPGAADAVRALRERGVATAIVSSGPELLALRAQRELGIDVVRANAVEIADGRLTGRSTISVPDGEKAVVGLAVLEELGVPPDRAASIGDSGSDAALAELVALPIAYDSASERLDRVSSHHLRHGELARLPALLD